MACMGHCPPPALVLLPALPSHASTAAIPHSHHVFPTLGGCSLTFFEFVMNQGHALVSQALSWTAVLGILALHTLGYAIFRGANLQKDIFRQVRARAGAWLLAGVHVYPPPSGCSKSPPLDLRKVTAN